MKISRIFSSLTIISLLSFSSLGGCRQIARNIDNIPTRTIDDVIPSGRIPRSNPDIIIEEGVEQIAKNIDFDLVKEVVYKCAEESGFALMETTIQNAIAQGFTEISTNYLLNLSNQAIQECTVIKIGSEVQKLGQLFPELTNHYSYELINASYEVYGQDIFFVE